MIRRIHHVRLLAFNRLPVQQQRLFSSKDDDEKELSALESIRDALRTENRAARIDKDTSSASLSDIFASLTKVRDDARETNKTLHKAAKSPSLVEPSTAELEHKLSKLERVRDAERQNNAKLHEVLKQTPTPLEQYTRSQMRAAPTPDPQVIIVPPAAPEPRVVVVDRTQSHYWGGGRGGGGGDSDAAGSDGTYERWACNAAWFAGGMITCQMLRGFWNHAEQQKRKALRVKIEETKREIEELRADSARIVREIEQRKQ